MKHRILSLLAIVCFASCVKDPEFIQNEELGCEFPRVEVSALSGSHSFNVISNTSCTVTLAKDDSWVRFASKPSVREMAFDGDFTIALDYDANEGEERQAKVTVATAYRTLELVLVQNNVNSKSFHFQQHNMLIGFENGSHSIPFTYNVPVEEISYEVTYENGNGWIEEPVAGVIGGDFVFAATENISQERRGAIITLSAHDKVGRLLTANLYVSQMASTEVATIPVTVADVRNFTYDDLDGENRIRRNYVLKARVLSDNSEGNGAPNRNISTIMQDLTQSSRTVYLQSLEPDEQGQYCGIKLTFRNPEDNSTNRYDLVEINLKGLVFKAEGVKGSDDPFRVSLSDAAVVNIVSCVGGSKDDLPVISRKISEIADDDIYTYVQVPDCEIPFRKGPFVPVDLRYQNIINKYPMAVRDADASIIYLMSNTTCAWARDGKGLPEGAGTISAIVVKEACDNFEWDSAAAAANTLLDDYITDVGYIGKYQLRPVTRSEIALSESLEDGVSSLIREWRYFNSLYPERMVITAVNDTLYPSYPASLNPAVDPELKAYLRYSGGKISTGQDWTHLGPVMNGVITDIPGSNGVYDALGNNIHWKPISYCSTCGIIQGENGSSWHGGNWFSGNHDNPKLDEYYWEIAFSTEGYTAAAAPLSVNLGVSSAYGDDTGAPRYWTLEYSTDQHNWTSVTGASEGGDWVDYTAKGSDYTYTIPDFPLVASKRQYNLPGNKYISINLPDYADVWGKQTVYIRLHPAKDLSGYNGSAAVSYDSAPIANSRRSCLNYVGIRCQK